MVAVYRRTVRTTLRASYTGHCRHGLVALLDMLEFRSNNTVHRPVIEGLALIGRYATAGNLTYYPLGETVPEHRGTSGEWSSLIYRTDTRGWERVARMVYEVATFQALRELLRCKEIWVVGAEAWRNPEQDLPADFAQRRQEHYREFALVGGHRPGVRADHLVQARGGTGAGESAPAEGRGRPEMGHRRADRRVERDGACAPVAWTRSAPSPAAARCRSTCSASG